jgi:hypothetical protein
VDPRALTETLLARQEASPDASDVMVIGFAWIALALLWLWLRAVRVRHGRRARDAEAVQATAAVRLGLGECVVAGKVDDDGQGDVVTVRIRQQGREWKVKGGWRHAWREKEREVKVRPFYVMRPSGERVRVEPDQRTFLVDKLDGIEPTGDEAWRVRTATLKPGEPVNVLGTMVRGMDPLQGGYRDAGAALVLRPPRSGQMLISTEPLAARHQRAAKLYRGLAMATLIAFLFSNGLYFLGYNVLRLGGSVVDAQITSSNTWKKWHKPKRGRGYWVHHYQVTAGELSDECSYGLYAGVQSGAVTRAPFLVAGSFHQIGMVPTQSVAKLIWFGILFTIFAIVIFVIVASSRPWWDRRRINDETHGRLNKSTVMQT